MKRALLIGINYIGSSCELNGCINDTHNVQKLLVGQFNYDNSNIILLDDSGSNPLKPTKENILKYLKQCVSNTLVGDTLFIHYSGHGSQVIDIDGDEKNNIETPGMDSVLCPCDYGKHPGSSGFILDDELKVIINKLPGGSKLRAFFDCCHGATMFDLPYIYRNGSFSCVEKLNEGTDDCLTISGCRDNQTSADAFIARQYSGALTWALLKVLNNVGKVPTTWFSVLSVTQHYLATDSYTQVPVLCTGNKDVASMNVDL